MRAFADLLDRLSYSPSRNAKLRLMEEYFRRTPDPDRGWALAVLTDGLPFSFPLRRTLMDMMAGRMDAELFRLSRDYVGDTAETIALVWEGADSVNGPSPLVGGGDGRTPAVGAPPTPSPSPPGGGESGRRAGRGMQLPLPLGAAVISADDVDGPSPLVGGRDGRTPAVGVPPTPSPSPPGGGERVERGAAPHPGPLPAGGEREQAGQARREPRLGEIVSELALIGRNDLGPRLEAWLDALDTTGRWALLKLLTGALRVGVSARLAKTAAAGMAGADPGEIEEIWHGLAPPYVELFTWLDGRGPKPDAGQALVFRPLMLSHALEEDDWAALDPAAFQAEWKWDGIRVQIAARDGEVHLYSRTGDEITPSFPDVTGTWCFDAVLDGELLVLRGGEVAPFNDLQQRLNRKGVTRKQMEQFPAHVRLYDALAIDGEDLRSVPLAERRVRLEAWHARVRPARTDLSPVIAAMGKEELRALWSATRATGIEGIMLKRRDSVYVAGRPKGLWWKWKRAPLTLDCVLMYAQRGSGKRSSYYSDYTFGAWRDAGGGVRELVPVGKAYFGFTDEELLEIDRWVRNHTVESFGPVRAVEPGLVFEVAFDAVQASMRHKSGVAMRFPRIHRIRWDKPAGDADSLEALMAMIEG